MTNSSNSNLKIDIAKLINNLDEKMNEFSEILQKFGLDVITKMGQTNSKIKILTDKINDLDKATIDIKALIPKLNNIIDSQNILESELDLIKSLLIQRTKVSESIERNESVTKNKKLIFDQFIELINKIETTDNTKLIVEQLKEIRENIFELTGGHKILYEVSQAINKLEASEDSLSNSLKNDLKEKIGFWGNKL
ncbi:MAG: hypothetical protein ACFFAN_13295 [Promethearchaeota archaeon]